MSTPIDDGGPAYPCHGPNGQVFNHGMSLRDYMAGQALPAKLASNEAWNDMMREQGSSSRISKKETAEACYLYADAMLAARKEKP